MSDKPQVSIIIPIYNYAHFLKRTLDSVFEQTYQYYEVIIVDDGSEDDPFAVIEPYGNKVRYLRQENQGVCAARNAGLEIAAGEYILFLDADDYIVPDKLNAQVALMKASPTYGIVNSGWWLVDENENVYDCVTPWEYAPRLDLETWLLWKPGFPAAMLFRKSVIEAAGGYDPAFTQAEDVELVLRMMLTGCEAVWLKRPTAYYRQHPNNTVKNSLGQTENMVRVLEKFYSQDNLPLRIQKIEPWVWHSSLLWNCANLFEAGHIAEMIAYLRLAAEKREKNNLDIFIDFYEQLNKDIDQPVGFDQLFELLYELISSDINNTAWTDLDIPPEKFIKAFGEFLRIYNLAVLLIPYDLEIGVIQELSSRQITKILSMQIVGNSSLISSKGLFQLWREMRKAGLISKADRFEIITIYLTLFTKCVFSLKWSKAIGYWFNAVARSGHPKAIVPWYRFYRSAIKYFIERIKGIK